ncbi:uncharacterized protein EI97DRAFT_381433 [Westerdykella ornata]|uniref:Uncharacterized protein n=1 Tax=Westerdykella ornata TaxID=318751 RepID=A0A6A6JGZ0_WESOR|nr:uncharacterized protein EI97DRAFT_381433 [Westerdykella ornata]KAF2274489.1 hypothetical protein EI97DRAFT_381433 [Westerdykella ornata]
MSEAFHSLRWPVFEDISNIRVASDPDSAEPELLPFEGHPIAAEAATKIPLKEIAFSLEVLDNYEAAEFEAPDRVFVRGADGGIVTVADVVKQLSAYFIAHKEAILEAKFPFLDFDKDNLSNTRVFFDGFTFIIEPGMYSLPVELWAEGENGESANHWRHGV